MLHSLSMYCATDSPSAQTGRSQLQKDATANLRSLETKERCANMLSEICSFKLEKASLTVQIQDLVESQGIQHPDAGPCLPVFPEHSNSIVMSPSQTSWTAKLSKAFWEADVAHQRATEEFVAQLQILLKDRVSTQLDALAVRDETVITISQM